MLELDGNELVLSNGDDADSIVDLSAYLDNVDSFAAVNCPAATAQVLMLTGQVWSCADPTNLETLTTIGFDAANQTIDYVD